MTDGPGITSKSGMLNFIEKGTMQDEFKRNVIR